MKYFCIKFNKSDSYIFNSKKNTYLYLIKTLNLKANLIRTSAPCFRLHLCIENSNSGNMELLSRTVYLVCILMSFVSLGQLAFSDLETDGESEGLVSDITAPRTDLLRTEVKKYIYGPATRIKFKIIEEESGVAYTQFKIADLPFMKSDGRQMVPHQLEDGSYTIQYYSVDKVGNQEQIRSGKIYVDKKGPEIKTGFNSSPSSFENGLPVFSDDIEFAVEVSDEQVEVHKLTYQINDGEVIKSSETAFIDLTKAIGEIEDDEVKIEIKAYDSFYNLSKEIVEFKIKR